MTRLTITLILAAFPAFAETEGWNGDPPPKEDPPVTVTIPNNPGGSAYDPYSRVYFGSCLCDGTYTTAWGFETYEFRKQAAEHQCRVLNEKRQCAITDDSYVGGLK